MDGSDNETINLEEHSENAPVPKKKRNLTSVVWAHVVRFEGTDKKVRARCKHCKKLFAGGSNCGTTSLKKHLKGRCRALTDVDVATIGGAIIFSPKGVALEFDQERSRADFINMVVKHNLPLNLVEYEYFKIWVNNLQRLYKVMSRNTARADVLHLYAEEKERIYGVLGNINSKVTLITDLWMADHQDIRYLCLSDHYINDNWELKKRILAFKMIEWPHDGVTLFEVIKELVL